MLRPVRIAGQGTRSTRAVAAARSAARRALALLAETPPPVSCAVIDPGSRLDERVDQPGARLVAGRVGNFTEAASAAQLAAQLRGAQVQVLGSDRDNADRLMPRAGARGFVVVAAVPGRRARRSRRRRSRPPRRRSASCFCGLLSSALAPARSLIAAHELDLSALRPTSPVILPLRAMIPASHASAEPQRGRLREVWRSLSPRPDAGRPPASCSTCRFAVRDMLGRNLGGQGGEPMCPAGRY